MHWLDTVRFLINKWSSANYHASASHMNPMLVWMQSVYKGPHVFIHTGCLVFVCIFA